MIITQEQIDVLEKHIPNVRELVEADDVQAVLDAANDVIVDNILVNGDMLDDEGVKVQRVWDQIFNQND